MEKKGRKNTVPYSRRGGGSAAPESSIGCQPVDSYASLALTTFTNWEGRSGYRAHMSIHVAGHVKGNRQYGCWRQSVQAAADQLLDKFAHRISGHDLEHARNAIADMCTRRTAMVRTAPCVPSWNPLSAASQTHQRSPGGAGVTFIHQIHGLYDDGFPMSPLFEKSHRRWSQVAAGMGATYILWGPEELASLIKNNYPQHWDMYCDVRYPIMRCDIGRIAILHRYGGLYADLDVEPNREWYEHVKFALQMCPEPEKTKDKQALPDRPETVGHFLDMEVIIGSKGNPVFPQWLDYISGAIVERMYTLRYEGLLYGITSWYWS